MARFDVFENKSGAGFLLDVQSDLLGGLNSRVVVPLLPKALAPSPAHRLNPAVSFPRALWSANDHITAAYSSF